MILALGMVLDALFGEPRWLWSRLPHPAVLTGRLIAAADIRLNAGSHRRARGLAVTVALAGAALGLGWVLAALPGQVAEVICLAVLLAQRSLADHLTAVADALHLSTTEGRHAVAMIVGRDTGDLDPPAIARAAIESGAENLSDAVVAPVLWFALFGLPGLLLVKAINTADSMIGYKTPRHAAFGWAAARLDDLLMWAPARLTAVLIHPPWRPGWPAIRAEAARHRSPNAGWPEAAMARAEGVALSGPRRYHGTARAYPFVHPDGRRDLGPAEISRAVTRLWRVWAVLLGLVLLGALAAPGG